MTPIELRGAALDLRGRAAALEAQERALALLVSAHLSVTAWASPMADDTRRALVGDEFSTAARLRRAVEGLRQMARELDDRADAIIEQQSADAVAVAQDVDRGARPGTSKPAPAPAKTAPPIGVS